MIRDDYDLLELLGDEIEAYRSGIRELPVAPEHDPEAIRAHLKEHYRFESARDPQHLFEDVRRMLRQWSVHVPHPRYFGLFNPSVTLPSIVGDALAAAYNPQLAAWSHAPAMNEIERHVLDFLGRSIGLDPATRGNFTSGGAEANQSAVIVALADRVAGYVDSGVGQSRPVIYVSSESHHSFHKAAVMAGIGDSAIRTIPVDGSFRMDVAALAERIAIDRDLGHLPLLVVATLGTTSSGAVDPVDEIAEVCAREYLWLHVDAAWGGSYLLVDELRSRFGAVRRADSVTWDAHKALSVPMGAGMFFCRHPEAVLRAFGVRAAYMPRAEEGTIDPYTSTVQWSRRAIGLKVFFSLTALGREGYQSMLGHQAEMANILRRRLIEKGWTIVNDTPLPLVCFTRPELGDDAEGHARFAHRLQQRGRVWISHTVLAGAIPALRACITSYQTGEADIETLVQELEAPAT